jgi:hypothetical protein
MRVAALLLLAPAACSANPMARLHELEGSWSGKHRLLGDDRAYAADYTIRREGRALVWEFRSDWNGGFTGRGIQHWDPRFRRVMESWTDSLNPGTESVSNGAIDPDTGILVMNSEETDPATGARVPYLHVTRIVSRDAWNYVMTRSPEGAAPQDVMWIEMRRN